MHTKYDPASNAKRLRKVRRVIFDHDTDEWEAKCNRLMARLKARQRHLSRLGVADGPDTASLTSPYQMGYFRDM